MASIISIEAALRTHISSAYRYNARRSVLMGFSTSQYFLVVDIKNGAICFEIRHDFKLSDEK